MNIDTYVQVVVVAGLVFIAATLRQILVIAAEIATELRWLRETMEKK